MNVKLIQRVDGLMIASEFDLNDIEAALSIRGYQQTGINQNPNQRAELQGLPTYAELAGPMYDGGKIRYEDWASNERLSA
jgi:hypothetical protein